MSAPAGGSAPGTADAWYVYGLRETPGPAPEGEAILPDSRVEVLPVGGLAVLASRVPRPLFDRRDPANRTGEPDWMAARVRAYHAVNAAAAEAAEAFLPLAFGTLFSSLDLLGGWLAPRAAALRAGLARVAGRCEWQLTLSADATHDAWLDRHDPALRALADAVAAAGQGTAFLLARRQDKARAASRARHAAAAAAAVAAALDETAAVAGTTALAEAPGAGPPAWSVLAPRAAAAAVPPWSATLAPLAAELASTGLVLRLTGPWPAYAFARAAMVEEAADA